MQKILCATQSASRILVWIGDSLIIMSALLLTAEVILRKLFNISIGGADELSGYAFGVATSLGFAFVLFERAHIRVDALYNLFPLWLKLIASLFGLALLTGFALVVTITGWDMVADTLEHGSRSITPMRTPLAIPQIPWLIGWVFFVFCGVLLFVAAVVAMFSGQARQADQLIGMKTVIEQIEDEKV